MYFFMEIIVIVVWDGGWFEKGLVFIEYFVQVIVYYLEGG